MYAMEAQRFYRDCTKLKQQKFDFIEIVPSYIATKICLMFFFYSCKSSGEHRRET
jgi:hypothetical protein